MLELVWYLTIQSCLQLTPDLIDCDEPIAVPAIYQDREQCEAAIEKTLDETLWSLANAGNGDVRANCWPVYIPKS